MTQITSTKRICEHLEKYVYDRIWNEPYTEFRTYTRPGLLNNSVKGVKPIKDASGEIVSWVETTSATPISGFFSGRYSHILLPPHKSPDDLDHWLPTDSTKFFLYAIPDRFFDSIKVNVKEWTLLSDYCNANCVDFHVFTPSGYCLNRGAIYLCQATMGDCMLLAVDADMVLELFGDYSEVGNVLFGKYVDSDTVADNRIEVKRLDQTDIKNPTRTPSSKVFDIEDSTYLLYNGKLVTGEWKSIATAGAYLEGVRDEDIVGYFEVDCDPVTRPVYNDVATSSTRLLIHIPKELDPDRYLITPHTCDMWLVPTEMSSGKPAISGTYISLAGNEGQVWQITHGDFSISMSYLESVAASHYFTKYKLRVYVRYHNKKKEFVRDYNYIDMLYNLEDEEIIQFLLGKHAWQQAKPVPDVSCEYDPDVTLYWYKDDTAAVGYSCVSNIVNETAFNEAKTKHGNLYIHPYEQLLFWQADHLENCKYADALVRKRNGHYQDPTHQCSLCPNKDNCLEEKANYERKPVAERKAWETARIAELTAYGVGTATGTIRCDRFVRTPANQCTVCGLRYDTDLIGTTKKICTIPDSADPTSGLGYSCPYYHVRSMRDYIQILGYFHVLSLVGKRVWHFKVTKNNTYDYSILAPLALSYPELNPTDFHCLVYHNGYRVDQDRITVSSTNKENSGAEEMEHGTGCLSRSTLVIQSNFATRLMVSIEPKFTDCNDHRVLADTKYYKRDSAGKIVEATICQSRDEFDDMSHDQKSKVDYIVSDLINKDKDKEFFLTPDEVFTTRVYYGKLDSATTYTLLVPGEGNDYIINETEIADICEERTVGSDEYHVYYKAINLITATREFCEGDTVGIEVFDNRQRKDESGEDEVFVVLPKHTTTDPRTITTYTDNQYKLYKVTSDNRNGSNCFKYEKIPDDDVGTLDIDPSGQSFTLTINPTFNNDVLLFVEGPKVVEKSCTRVIDKDTFGVLGSEFFTSEERKAFPLDSTILFMNGKRLIPNLDYYLDSGEEILNNVRQILPYVQNLSYIWNGTRTTQMKDVAKINFIRSNTTDISTQYGFMIGKKITWAGQAPFWFDELSTLTIDGEMCSNFKHSLGMVSVADDDHRNGAPYEIHTACSTRVMEIVGCRDEQAGDMSKIHQIRTFFEVADLLPRMEVIIPHSHKVYSTYLEAICHSYLCDPAFDFETHKETTDTSFQNSKTYYVKQAGSLRPITVAERSAGMKTGVVYYEELGDTEFKNQFSSFNYWKNLDLTYRLSKFDLGFVDVYPMYHRAAVASRDEYNKLRYLNNKLAPVDHIKHKDAIHE